MRTIVTAAVCVMAWLVVLCPVQVNAQSNGTVIVAFTTTNSIPLNQGFAGFCTEMLTDAVEYWDTNFQQIVTTLSPGWLRYPGGATSDAFQWTNGLTMTNWIPRFPVAEQNLLNPTVKLLSGKGGAQFSDFANLCANVGGARIVVCINGFTDTAGSAGAFAAYALSNHISVAAWELCNEPYIFTGTNSFFRDSTNYVTLMKPYRDAIKAADSNAVVAIYFSDAGFPEANWDNALASYTNKYWDAVVYHHYPTLPTNGVPFSALMALDNWQLASNTTSRVLNYLMPKNSSNITYLITEYAPALGNGTGGQNPPTTTLYGGIYAAEYTLRMSTIPQMTYVGPYQLLDAAGIAVTNNNYQPVTKAYDNGQTTNTAGLPFGFYMSAQVCGEAVADWALTRSTAVYPTTVGTNCPTVPIVTNGVATMPAIYAQAYQGGNGKLYVVLTNKGSNAVPMQIKQNSIALTNQFLESFVKGNDPSIVNVNPPVSSNVVIESNIVTNPVTIPEYSVVRLEWTVFSVPQPTINITSMGMPFALQWNGMTNVTYCVQETTNLLGTWTWATLGKLSSGQTTFSFTDLNNSITRFYRLIVQ